jgi:hypothetical protein
MTPPADPERYKNHRFPGEIISHGVWLYYRFPLSYRDVEEILLERGIDVTHEAIRQWCLKFGQGYANQLKCVFRAKVATASTAKLPRIPPQTCHLTPGVKDDARHTPWVS